MPWILSVCALQRRLPSLKMEACDVQVHHFAEEPSVNVTTRKPPDHPTSPAYEWKILTQHFGNDFNMLRYLRSSETVRDGRR